MRSKNERLVVFSDYQYERSIRGTNAGVLAGMHPGLFPTLNYKETEYSVEGHNGCKMRTDFRADPADTAIKLMVFNHFSPISIAKDYGSMNKYSDIMKRVASCLANGFFPNFIAVDYFELGDCSNCISTKQVVHTLNLLHPAIQSNIASYSTHASTIQQQLPTYTHPYSFYKHFKPWLCSSALLCVGASVGYILGYKVPYEAGQQALRNSSNDVIAALINTDNREITWGQILESSKLTIAASIFCTGYWLAAC